MRRRALLASAAALPAVGTAGCLASLTAPDVEVTHYDDPRDADTPGVPLGFREDASLADAWALGEPTDDDPNPVHVAVYNAAGEQSECSVILSVDGNERVNARWSLDAGEYVRFTLYAPRKYVAAVGHRPDLHDVVVERNDFDCNEKSVTAAVAADGTVETGGATTDMGCGSF